MINAPDVEIEPSILNKDLHNLMDKCFPVRSFVMSSCDPPWITPLVKYLLRKKKRAADRGHTHKAEDFSSKVYKFIGENRKGNRAGMEHQGVCTGGGEWIKSRQGKKNLTHI